MSDLSRDARELIARARAAERADASAKKRVRAALSAHLGMPSLPATPPGPGLAGAAGAGLSASKVVLICSLTVAGLAGTAVVVKGRHAAEPRPAPQVISRPPVSSPVRSVPMETQPLTDAPPTSVLREAIQNSQPRRVAMRRDDPPMRAAETSQTPKPLVAVSPLPERTVGAPPAVSSTVPLPQPSEAVPSSWQSSHLPTPVPDRPAARIPTAPVSSKECTAERELGLLSNAQAALREGNGRRALDLLDQHAQTCPTATFWQERSAARVLALCLLHRQPQALAEAAQLASVAPRSPLLARLRTSCAALAVKP